MKNNKGSGDIMTVAAPEDATSGEFLIKGGIHGVAGITVASGADVPLHRNGVFTLPKATSQTWAVGDRLFWDVSAKKFTTDATKRPIGAVAAAAAGSSDTTGDVLLQAEGGQRVVGGQHTTVTATDTVVTGLARVDAVVASYDTDPADANTYVSATKGDQAGSPAAGSIIIKTWKQSGTDPTPIAADAFTKLVNWIAIGV